MREDMEEARLELELVALNYSLDNLPLTEEQLTMMKAWLKMHVGIEKDKLLFSLIDSNVSNSVLEAINQNRAELTIAIKEWNRLRWERP